MMASATAAPSYIEGHGDRLHYVVWRHNLPRARVVLLHGLESHSGWFADFGARLAARGHLVIGLDRAGAGRSEGRRGDGAGVGTLVAQLRAVLSDVAPSLPTFVLGFSWGARLALAHAVEFPHESRGLVLMAPGLRLQTTYPALTRAAVLASAVLWPTTRVRTPVPRDEWFTTQAAPLAFIRSDPWRLSRVTSRLLLQSWSLERRFAMRAEALRVPILHLVAGSDRVCDNDRNRDLLRAAVGDSLYAERVYEGAEHALMFECDRHPIVNDIANWIAPLSS